MHPFDREARRMGDTIKEGRARWLARPHLTPEWYAKHRARGRLPKWIRDHFEPREPDDAA